MKLNEYHTRLVRHNDQYTAIVLDDHRMFADSFATLIDKMKLYRAVHCFYEPAELNEFLLNNNNCPIHLFIDYYLDGVTALTLVNYFRKIVRNAKIIFISSVTNPVEIGFILSGKVNALISKTSDTATLLECLRTIEKGRQYVCPFIAQLLDTKGASPTTVFTARELDMLHRFNQGLSIDDTALQTNLSRHTVIAHRRNMMQKSNTNSITELLAYARLHKYIM
ncbi:MULTISPECIES: LuxR C-terminal-related transcriptional regulator [Chitinophagaceae]